MNIEKETMSPEHELWVQFYNALSDEVTANGCYHTHKSVETVLKNEAFLNIDTQKTISFLEEHGGYCDCEALMNVG